MGSRASGDETSDNDTSDNVRTVGAWLLVPSLTVGLVLAIASFMSNRSHEQ